MNKNEHPSSSEQMLNRHMRIIRDMKRAMPSSNPVGESGLANLQQATLRLMDRDTRKWGFTGSPFRVVRQKIASNLWKLTVEDPKTHEIILEAEGRGDKIFAYEDSLARMVEALTDCDLTITTPNKN